MTSAAAPARVSFVCDSNAWGGAEVWVGHLLRRASARGWTASLVCTPEVADGFPPVPGERAVVPLARHADEAPAVGGASVTVFLPGDPVRWAHRGPRHRSIAADVACAPCPHLECPIDFRCATSVRPDAVLAAARDLVRAAA